MSAFVRAQWVDANGNKIAPTFWVDDQAGADAILTAMATYNNALNTIYVVSDVYEGVGQGIASPLYKLVGDVADLTFASASGALAHYLVPAASTLMFLGDGETALPGNIPILTAAILAHGRTASGQALTTYLQGFRRSGRRRATL